jgi:hypothetical protein
MPIKVAQPQPRKRAGRVEAPGRRPGAQEIGVLDDSANIRVKRLEELASSLIEQKLNHVPWIFVNGIRANLASKELLSLLKTQA